MQIEAERQLLRGTSGGNEVQGLLTSRGVPVYAGGTAAGNKAVQLFKAMNGMRGSAFVEPEWIVLAPDRLQERSACCTDTAGQFFGGGPFHGPVRRRDEPRGVRAAHRARIDSLWNKPVYVTAGDRRRHGADRQQPVGAGVEPRGPARRGSNSHASNFTLDLSVIRAERRLALTCYRANGFVEARIS